VLQVDGHAGFKRLAGDRADGSVSLAFCWAHMRRKFYEFHQCTGSPLAADVLARIRALYEIEADIRGKSAERRQQARCAQPDDRRRSARLATCNIGRVSGTSDLAEAMRYAIRHWAGLVLFLDDGRVELDTNVVERAIRPIALARKNALFAGSDGGARHWAVAMTLIATAKLNGVEPMAYLTDVLERIVAGQTRTHQLDTLLLWNWLPSHAAAATPIALAA
jgi:transposase